MAADPRSLKLWRISAALVWIGVAFSLFTVGSLVVRDRSSMAASGPTSFPPGVVVKTVLVYAAVFTAAFFAWRGSPFPRKSGIAVASAALVVLIAGCLGLYNILLVPTTGLFLIGGLLMLFCAPADRAASDE